MTSNGCELPVELMPKYFHNLVNQFFKILPMRENNEKTSETYMLSLQAELLGCKEFVEFCGSNPSFLTLLAILQYLIDNPTCDLSVVRREVFQAISVCKKLEKYCANAEVDK